jgi:hypothetical protein
MYESLCDAALRGISGSIFQLYDDTCMKEQQNLSELLLYGEGRQSSCTMR